MSTKPHVLVIGCGSIGERHLRCFQHTGRCDVTACDTNPALLSAMKERYDVAVTDSLDGALAEGKYDAAVICVPAQLHLPFAIKLLKAGCHLLIEKPLAIEDSLVPEVRAAIEKAGRHVAVAYVYHLMPWVQGAREFIRSGVVGDPVHVMISGGQHFPTYRPAYRDIYYNNHATGGGAIQDALTHLVNATEWIIGPCTRLFCDASHQVLEGVNVEDTVNITARHGSILVSYAMNQFQAANEFTFQFHTAQATVSIEAHRQRWGFMRRGETEWTWHQTPPQERDVMFIAQATAFLDGMEGRENPLCTFEEAVQTLKFNQMALRSISTGLPLVIE